MFYILLLPWHNTKKKKNYNNHRSEWMRIYELNKPANNNWMMRRDNKYRWENDSINFMKNDWCWQSGRNDTLSANRFHSRERKAKRKRRKKERKKFRWNCTILSDWIDETINSRHFIWSLYAYKMFNFLFTIFSFFFYFVCHTRELYERLLVPTFTYLWLNTSEAQKMYWASSVPKFDLSSKKESSWKLANDATTEQFNFKQRKSSWRKLNGAGWYPFV